MGPQGFTPRGGRGGRGGFGGGGRGRGTPRGGRGGTPRGGRGGGRGASGGGSKVLVEPHRFDGIYIAKSPKEEVLVTKSIAPGESVYGEKKIEIENEAKEKTEYRVWNPFRSKLAACVINGIEDIYIEKGSKVLYLGAANGTTVSHVSDLVGPEGIVYAVEFSLRSGRDLVNMAAKRPNVVPIIEDARHPLKYRLVVNIVDTIFADVAQPDQARIVSLNAQYFLKEGGNYIISIKANCIDSVADPDAVFAGEVEKLKKDGLKPKYQISLEPYERDHAVVSGVYIPIASDD